MSQQDALMYDDDIDIIGIFAQLKKYWWLVCIVPLIVGALLLVGLSLATPKYVSTAKILFEDTAPFTSTTEDSNRIVSNNANEERARNQVEVIQSNDILLPVIDKMQLVQDKEFQRDGLLASLSDLFQTSGARSERYEALKIFKKKLEAYVSDETSVVNIEFSSASPEKANAIVTAITEQYSIHRSKINKNATAWLEPEIKQLEKQLKDAEKLVAKKRREKNLLLSDNDTLLATQQLSELSSELTELKAEWSSAQSRAASIRSALKNGSSIDVIPEVIDSPLIQRLREREVALRAEISDLSTTLLPNHPSLRSLNSQVTDFQQQIRRAATNILASLENNVAATRKAEADLEKQITELKKEAAKVNDALVELRPFEQDVESKRSLLEDYRGRFEEAKSRDGLDAEEIQIFAASLPTEASFPKIIPYTLVGTLMAFILTIVMIIASSLLSAAVRQRDATQANDHGAKDQAVHKQSPAVKAKKTQKKKSKRKIFGSAQQQEEHVFFAADEDVSEDGFSTEDELTEVDAPKLDMSENDTPMAEEQSTADDSALAVRYAASVIADLNEAHVLVTSPGGDAGSRTAWMLARSIAKSDKNTLIIDLSGGGATASEMLGSNELPGLYALMSGAVTFDHIVYQDRISQAHVVPAGVMYPYMPPINISAMNDVIDAIKQSYEFVIIDCGDADVEGLQSIADVDSIFIISGIGAKPSASRQLENALIDVGFRDILKIIPDSVDNEKDSLALA